MLVTEQAALHFPVSAEMPESWLHMEVRTLLWQFLKLAFKDVAMLGSEQFVYWDPEDPKACLAPDAFVRLGERHRAFRSWKVWERGTPDVAVEIISDSDAESFPEKFAKYRRLRVRELVWFDPGRPEHPLRIWDSVAGDLAERPLSESRAWSNVLSAFWQAVEDAELGLTLRLSSDEQGAHLFPTPAERAAQELQAEATARRAEAKAHRAEAAARRIAEERVRQLEAELARKK